MMRAAAVLGLACLAWACYQSPHEGTDASSDPATDGTDAPDRAYSVTLVMENASPLECSSCVRYLSFVWYYSEAYDYGVDMDWNGEPIGWHAPGCTAACQGLEDPMMCCMQCGVPVPMVRQLVPGERIEVTWDGGVYTMDTEPCECGCYWRSPAPAGSGRARVCAYPSFVCTGGATCGMNAEGFIEMAEGDGEAICSAVEFSFPADSGGELVLSL